MVKSALVGNADLLEGWKLVKRTPQPRNTPIPVPPTPTLSVGRQLVAGLGG